MKKVLSLLICFNLFVMPAIGIEQITDNFAEASLKNSENQTIQPNKTEIKDDLVNSTFKLKAKKIEPKQVVIEDAQIQKYLESKKYEKPDVKLEYDYTSIEQYPIKIKVANYYTTRNKNTEGKPIKFYTKEKITLSDGRIIPAKSIIEGRVETISQNGTMGVPADLSIGSFKIKDYPDVKIESTIEKTGAKRIYWVYPLAYLGALFFVVGWVVTYPIFLPIRGGHAKLYKWQTYTIYYKP